MALSNFEVYSLLAQIVNQNRQPMSIFGLDRKIIWINDAAEKLFGYSKVECIGQASSDLLFGEETDLSVMPKVFEAMRRGEFIYSDLLVYTKNKEKLWVTFCIQPLKNEEGVVDKFCLYSEDITSRKKSELQLLDTLKNYHELKENSSDIIFETNEQTEFTNLNTSWYNILGLGVVACLGKRLQNYINPNDLQLVEDALTALKAKQIVNSKIELRIFALNLEVHWFELMMWPIFNRKNQITGFKGILKDITAKRKQQYIQELLYNNNRDLVCLHEINGDYVFVSPSIIEIAGYYPDELIGRNTYEFFHENDLEKISEFHRKILSNETTTTDSITFRYKKKDGTYTWLESHTKLITDTHANKQRVVTSTKVINTRKKDEENLLAILKKEKELNELKSGFLSIASHEFRTPLAVIKSTIELLQIMLERDEINAVADLEEALKSIDTEVDNMTGLIEDILILEKIESGKVHLDLREVDITLETEKCIKRITKQQKDNRTALVTVTGNPAPIVADAKYIDLIISNLLTNAFKYSVNCPNPTVYINYNSNNVAVTIHDFGLGIPETELGKLFNTFFRASNALKLEGTGLGLSIVKKYVELHHGTITIESKENKGTTAVVVLPTKQ